LQTAVRVVFMMGYSITSFVHMESSGEVMAGMPIWTPEDPMYPYRVATTVFPSRWQWSTEIHPAREPVSQFTTHDHAAGSTDWSGGTER
jgi:hypothetical protein